MQSIQEILNNPSTKRGSERNSILKDIYQIYQNERQQRKVANWKRYIQYLKNNRFPNNPIQQKIFKKSKLFIKELPPKVIAIKLSHIPTKDLYYVLSVCKDKARRNESAGAFIFGSIKISNDTDK